VLGHDDHASKLDQATAGIHNGDEFITILDLFAVNDDAEAPENAS
jgi:hypothetical protein